jgi:hypothetical protein
LRPCPVENTRARADSFAGTFAGTSTTCSPSATSRWARCRPIPFAAFDRPDPIRPPAGRREHLPVALPVGAEPAPAEDLLPIVEGLDRRRQLVRIHSDDDAAHAALLAFVAGGPARRATLLRAEQTLLQPQPRRGARPGHTPNESHTSVQ